MSEHYAIINNEITTQRDSASLELAADAPGVATFIVYGTGGAIAGQVDVPLSSNHFASSVAAITDNRGLFSFSNGQTALVKAVFPAGRSNAVLRQAAGPERIVMLVPPANEQGITILGTGFTFPLGPCRSGSFVLVGNPHGTPAHVDVTHGATGSLGGYDVPAFGVVSVPLEAGGAPLEHTQVRVTSTGIPVFVQVAIDTGRLDESVVLPL